MIASASTLGLAAVIAMTVVALILVALATWAMRGDR